MNLIIFDIDGTLTQTNEMDSDCFARAIEDVLRIDGLNTDWASYRYSTDSGLIKEIFESYFTREPTEQEINSIQDRFVTYLKDAWSGDRSLIIPIPGANSIFQKIGALSKWHIGIATGGWRQSALFKLDSANISHATLPIACADDHVERTEIINTTVRQAQAQHNVSQYSSIVYVGDRPWDESAATQLGIGFIGVGSQIKQQSQNFCVDNFNESGSFLHHLEMIV